MELIIGIVGGLLLIFFIFIGIYASRYVKVGPNEVLVISGRNHRYQDAQGRVKKRGFRIVAGGGTFVWPIFEKAEILSLELMTIDVKTPEVYSSKGVPVQVDGVAQVKVKGDEVSIGTAAEQFLSKSVSQIMHVALETLEGHLRAIIGQMTVEDIYQKREKFSEEVQNTVATDFANMGLQVVSFTIKDVRDNQGYLDALGKPRTAEVKRDAIIGQADADRDATARSAEAHRVGEEARFKAETLVAFAQRDYEMKRADYQASVNEKKAASDLAYDLQKNKTQQEVKIEEMRVIEIEKEKMIDIKRKELEATIEKPASAEKFKVQTLADAEKYKREAEAAGMAKATRELGIGEADANKARGLAEAQVRKAQGMAEAEVILAKGTSEAEAMQKKANAWSLYNEAAVAQIFIEKMPEVARAIAEPLSNTDRITIVSTGGDELGASKVTADVVKMMAQLPPVLEGVSGINLKDLFAKLPSISKKDGGTKLRK